ncbi:MAG: hypothetical protein ABL958_20505, partial [Bdellovibrionia bacterium]
RIKTTALFAILLSAGACNRNVPMLNESQTADRKADETIGRNYEPGALDFNSGIGVESGTPNDVGTTGAGTVTAPAPRVVAPAKTASHEEDAGNAYLSDWRDEDVIAEDEDSYFDEDGVYTDEELLIGGRPQDRFDGTTGAGTTEMDRLKADQARAEMYKHSASRWPIGTSRAVNERLNISTDGSTLPEQIEAIRW